MQHYEMPHQKIRKIRDRAKKFLRENLLAKSSIVGGLLTGLVNGLLGSGGGMVAVPALEKSGLSAKQAHSGSLAVVLPLSLFSAVMYISDGRVAISDALPYLPAGIVGSLCGAWLMSKISSSLLHKIFGLFAIWAGVRMLLR